MELWNGRSRHWLSVFAGRMVPAACLIVLSALPFLYRTTSQASPARITNISLLVAFSGQMQARGNDLYAATELAVQHANAGGGRPLVVVSALDDQAQPQTAQDQARGAGADAGISAVLCCTTAADEGAVATVLPPREPLVSLAASTKAMAVDEATLVRRQLGGGTATVVSDQTIQQDARATQLVQAFRAAGYAVTLVTANFAGGSRPGPLAASVAEDPPDIIVLDANYPAAAAMGTALRDAGVTASLVGDDRLDGAPAASRLAGMGPMWFVALDRAALLRQAPVTFAGDFGQVRGHAPSARDVLTYLQARAALHDGVAFVRPVQLPVVLYRFVPGVYPPPPVATVGGSST